MILQNLIDDAETTLQTKIGDRRSRAWPAPTFGSAGTFPFIYFNPFLPSLFFYRPFAALTWGRGARWEPPLDRGRWSPVRHAVPPPSNQRLPKRLRKNALAASMFLFSLRSLRSLRESIFSQPNAETGGGGGLYFSRYHIK